MRLESQGWVVVALGVLFVIASFLPWVGDNSAWSLQFTPLVVVVHLPVIVVVTITTLRATGTTGWRLPVLEDRQWLQVTALYALVGSVFGVLFLRLWYSETFENVPGGIPDSFSPGAGAVLTIAAAIAFFVVTFFGDRFEVLRSPSQVRQTDPGESRWISLDAPYASPEGHVLQSHEWYLAFDDNGAVVVQLDGGTEIELPKGFPIGEAPDG